MADFEPIRMTHPQGKGEDVIASTPAEYSDFRFRDGYVKSQDQRPLGSEGSPVVDDVTVGETAVVESEKPEPKTSSKAGVPKNTNADGKSVTTA